MRRSRFLACALLASIAPVAWAARAPVPGDSVYQLDALLTDQDGRTTRWGDGATGPRIVSMFFTHCDYACPLLFETIRLLEAALPHAERQALSVGLVSLDPARDTPATLKKMARQRGGDEARWRLYRANEADVRKLAAVLGIQYRRLASGDFSHSTALILLDAQGRVLARTEKMARVDPVFLAAVRQAMA